MQAMLTKYSDYDANAPTSSDNNKIRCTSFSKDIVSLDEEFSTHFDLHTHV
jgi:hypothetical protein